MARKRTHKNTAGGEDTKKSRRHSWLTTDEYEVEVRRKRAAVEEMTVVPLSRRKSAFGDFLVAPEDEAKEGRQYVVELWGVGNDRNYCTCRDFAKNLLGTCKHVEKVKTHVHKQKLALPAEKTAHIIAPLRRDSRPRVVLPPGRAGAWRRFLEDYLDASGQFRKPWEDTLLVFLRDLERQPQSVRDRIRVSRGIHDLAERIADVIQAKRTRKRFLNDFDNDTFLRLPLYDYQREGLAHLAFTGRALLTDEMGLGKTVQAIGAAKALHDLLKPIMLRRRKADIETQLPERVDNNYFVPMTTEQKKRYGEYEYQVLVLSNTARRRPLSPEEFDRLQRCLACMRMLCDTVYILDPEIRTSPKVNELMQVLGDIWSADPGRKVIVFSEWVRMLELVSDQLDEQGVGYALHVGHVPQKKRRDEINRFKNSPECNVFLSSDAGSVGLNLQAASVVVNLDLPWNPAKLEQRIARAWRKHQNRSVNVINFVSENTIEHRMLATLGFKQSLADSVVDGAADWEALETPNAKQSYMDRLSTVLNTSFAAAQTETGTAQKETEQPAPKPAELFRQEANTGLADMLGLCSMTTDGDVQRVTSVFGVAKQVAESEKQVRSTLAKTGHAAEEVNVTIVSPEQYAMLRDLVDKGIISFAGGAAEELFRSESLTEPEPDDAQQRRAAAEPAIKAAERSLRMARVLLDADFREASVPPLLKAMAALIPALAALSCDHLPEELPSRLEDVDMPQVVRNRVLDEAQAGRLRGLTAPESIEADPDDTAAFLADVVDSLQGAVMQLDV